MTQLNKPKIKLTGANGNIFNLLHLASTALKKSNLSVKTREMHNRVFRAGSYQEALKILEEYIDVS